MTDVLTPFFTGDQHFDHHNEESGKGILLYQKDTRPFKTIEEMNEAWIDVWNRVVPQEGAIVYNVGDILFGGITRLRNILERLHFDVLEIIPGNHDSWVKPNKGRYEIPLESGRLVVVRPLYHQIKVEDQRVVLCHFPMRSWNASYHGSWHLHGHAHGSSEPWGKSMDVGVDTSGGAPYGWPGIQDWMADREMQLREMRKEAKRAART